MKKVLLVFFFFALILTSCGDGKKEDLKKETETEVEEVKVEKKEVKTEATDAGDLVAMGEKLFTDKTCISCHQIETKVVGPSIQELMKVYEEKNGNIINFLKGTDPAIVDTDPGQVAIMKANLDGFVKDLSDKELDALVAYMTSVK
jgi:cytochrome c